MDRTSGSLVLKGTHFVLSMAVYNPVLPLGPKDERQKAKKVDLDEARLNFEEITWGFSNFKNKIKNCENQREKLIQIVLNSIRSLIPANTL
jgi:hypothetical protein